MRFRSIIAGAGITATLFPAIAADATRPEPAALCPMLKAAIAIGSRDNSFAALRSAPVAEHEAEVPATRAIQGFDCRISVRAGPIGEIVGNSIEGTTGFYSCARYDLGKGKGPAAAERIAAEIAQCLGIVPERADYKRVASYTFVVRAAPRMIVFVTPNGLSYEGVIVNLLAE